MVITMKNIQEVNVLRMEEMVQFLIRIVGKTNERMVELEERIRELESGYYVQQKMMEK